MKMTSIKMKRKLDERLKTDAIYTSYNRDKDSYRIEWKETRKGMTIKLPNVIAKYNERGEIAFEELVNHIEEALRIMNEKHSLEGMEKYIFPVIRATSFPTETKAKTKMVTKEHTAETRVFYALDLGKSYRLIDEPMIEQVNWTKEHLDEIATFNMRSLNIDYNKDNVADNDFYFIATQDGYDASRILNETFLEDMYKKVSGEMAVAVPHQDVLIVADIQNKTGYDILAQLTMQFFTEGRNPITSLPFIYEDKHLEPIFILAKNKPTKE